MTASDDLRDTNPDGTPRVPPGVLDDPHGLKAAHDRTGRMLHQAGLPFDEDEFDDDDDDSSGASTEPSDDASDDDASSSSGEDETSHGDA